MQNIIYHFLSNSSFHSLLNNSYANSLLVESGATTNSSVAQWLKNLLINTNNPNGGYLIYLLIMAGLFIIGAVLIYNWWEEKRFNAQVEKSFSPIKNDALLDQNKKQFLEKFAATTGYLNDTPDGSQEIAKEALPKHYVPDGQLISDDASLDDVYSELLNTMSKRNNGRKVADPNDYVDMPELSNVHEDTVIEYSNSVDAIAPIENLNFTANLTEDVTFNDESNNQRDVSIDATNKNPIKSIFTQVFSHKNKLEIDESVELEQTQYPPIVPVTHHAEGNVNTYVNSSILDDYVHLKERVEVDSQSRQETSLAAAVDQQTNSLVSQEPVSSNQMSLAEHTKSLSQVSEINAPQTQSEVDPNELQAPYPRSLNLLMDYIGVMQFAPNDLLSSQIELFSNLQQEFDKPVFIHVLNANQQWVTIRPTSHNNHTLINQVSKIVCSLQLADRAGATTKNMLNRFQSSVEEIAKQLQAPVAWLNEGDVHSAALALDAFCIEVDKTMSFHLTHDEQGAFTGTKLKGIAESQGLKLDIDGAFKYFMDAAEESKLYPAFTIMNRANHPFNPEMLRTSVVKAITFQLDIPHVKSTDNALDRMVEIAKNLVSALNAVLVDDNNRVLGDIHLDKIRDQIKSIHATMLLRGISPGSSHAHRLFS